MFCTDFARANSSVRRLVENFIDLTEKGVPDRKKIKIFYVLINKGFKDRLFCIFFQKKSQKMSVKPPTVQFSLCPITIPIVPHGTGHNENFEFSTIFLFLIILRMKNMFEPSGIEK